MVVLCLWDMSKQTLKKILLFKTSKTTATLETQLSLQQQRALSNHETLQALGDSRFLVWPGDLGHWSKSWLWFPQEVSGEPLHLWDSCPLRNVTHKSRQHYINHPLRSVKYKPNVLEGAHILGSKRRDCLAGYQFGSVKIKRDFTLARIYNDIFCFFLHFTQLAYLISETKLLYPKQWQLAPPAFKM